MTGRRLPLDLCRRLLLAALLIFSRAASLAAASAPIATVGLTPGWVTFGQAVPQGLAFDGLLVGSLQTQTDVKTRWPDGSIRFAVVTTQAVVAGDYPVTASVAAAGAFVPAVPAGSVTLTVSGQAYSAGIPPAPSPDLWLSGPLVYEGRSVVSPQAAGVTHPFLRVIFDVRVYNDRTARVDVAVENVLDKSGATTVTYDAAIAVNGVVVFSRPAVEHFYLTRWRKTFAVGATPFGAVVPDTTPFNLSRALPPYLGLVNDRTDVMAGPAYDILGTGALGEDMSAHGGRDSLAPYPDWAARYLVHKRPEELAFLRANGDLAGSWPMHVREDEDSATPGVSAGRFVSIDERPAIWLDERADPSSGADIVKGAPLAIKEYTDVCAAGAPPDPAESCRRPAPGQSRLIPDNAHQPSLAYVPYLITGDRYYADEMAFWANYGMLRTYNGDGVRGSSGILQNNEVRGFGWALRNIADAAAYHPDPAVSAYFARKVENNLAWLDEYVTRQHTIDGIPILWAGYRPEAGFISLWEQTYLAFAIDRANRLGFTGGLTHRDAIARLQLELFTSDPIYARETALPVDTTLPDGTVRPAGTVLTWGAPYLVGIGDPGICLNPGTTTTVECWATYTPHTTLAQVAAQTQVLGLQRDFAGFYGPEARLNLMIGIESGWTGAQEAYTYLYPFIAVKNFWGDEANPISDLAERAGWALDFYAPAEAPPPPPPTPVRAAITSPSPGSILASSHQLFQWDAGVGVTRYKLDVGTSAGASDIFAGNLSTALEQQVNGLPTDGRTVHVRLSSEIGGALESADYAYIAFTNRRPVLTPIADQAGTVGDAVRLQIAATDPDGDTLTYSALQLPAGLAIDPATGLVAGTLTGAGDFLVTVRVSDGSLAGETSFTWRVGAPASRVKTLVNPGPQRNMEEDEVDLQMIVVLNSPGADRFRDLHRVGSFSAVNLPPGLRIGKSRGRIHGHIRKGASQQSPYHVTVTLTEGARTFTVTFDWTVLRRKSGK